MALKIGIVGLPNAGKSTIFNALTKAAAEVANYPFCTIEPNVGVVPGPDHRVKKVFEIYRPPKATPATVEFVDIAGLVKGSSKGEGLGNQFLSRIREVDALLHIVRCFEDPNVAHVSGEVDPQRDIEVVNTELCIKDLETLENRVKKLEKNAKAGDKAARAALGICEKASALLQDSTPIRKRSWSREDRAILEEIQFLTDKPVLYGANVHEMDLPSGGPLADRVREIAKADGAKVAGICGKVEAEVMELSDDEAKAYLQEFGLKESSLDHLIRLSYELLGLVTFLTVNQNEVRAWTVKKGTKAPQAAGVVHTDFERGFIRAEVMCFSDLEKYGSQQAVKEKGLYRVEGKEYDVSDGDIIYFRFNV